MKLTLLLSFLFFFATSYSQRNEQVVKLVNEGVALHDKGDYEGALKKYDEALAIDKFDLKANYERAYTCLAAKKYNDCIEGCKFIIANFKDDPLLKQVYEVYGSTVDDSGNSDEAIRVFDEGLKKFPDYYLLHFNKGFTYHRLKKYDEALACYNLSLKNNGLHGSSNYYVGTILRDHNKVAALLAYLTFIAIEPQTDGSKNAFDAINDIFYQNVKKEGDKTIISINADLLDQKKNKNKENDFSTIEFFMSLSGAVEEEKGEDSLLKTAADKFDLKLQLLINSLDENKKNAKGFYWNHFVPFFVEMKRKGFTPVLSNLVFLTSDEKNSLAWLNENDKKVKEFYDWLDKYNWGF